MIRIFLVIALLASAAFVGLKGRRQCLTIVFSWNNDWPAIKFVAGRGYSSGWTSEENKIALFKSLDPALNGGAGGPGIPSKVVTYQFEGERKTKPKKR